jgi:hypothetical protein
MMTKPCSESDVLKATAQDIELVTSIVNGEADGRIFSDEVSAYQVSPTVAGTVTLGGSANLASVINTLNTNLSQTYPSLIINTAFNGLGSCRGATLQWGNSGGCNQQWN